MATENAGPIQIIMEKKLKDFFLPSHLEVINESYMHNVPKGSESHFKVVVVSEKLVHEAIDEEIKDAIHALTIVAKTPNQWESSGQKVDPSPRCLGGSKN
ncbi:DgyrCDS12137 [Dimorphilus gyrociliatus]|uniref:DgyrCDS12137 n=1 Tax=Dimorphilus gyrociliatus TaxID=2664684 RepID=A0A7I8W5I4_9ANNE|nr:DgyrCDS12137 [Dimorphilus gyrociliatus]